MQQGFPKELQQLIHFVLLQPYSAATQVDLIVELK